MMKEREMKDSGIPWIGMIPKGWEVKPFKAIYSLGKGLSITKADLVENGVSVISYGQIHSKLNNGTSIKDELIRYVPSSFIETNQNCLVNSGDVIFADTSEDLEGCGNCIFIDREMHLFGGYHTIIAFNKSNYKNKYFPYLFKTDSWRTQIRTVVNGVKLYSIPQRILSSTYIIVPPLSEQKAIAEFLDRKCGDIDELISLQERMIEELKAYKQSVVTEVVTKGLNPNTPLKDSGIEWIGQIPQHWEIKKIKNSCSLFGRIGFRGYTADDLVQEGEGAITLSPTNFEDIKLNLSKCSYLSWDKYYESPEIMVNEGDVLLVKTASVGKCIYVDKLPQETTVNPQILVLKEHKDNPKFIAYVFQTPIGQTFIEITKGGSTIFTISQEKIGNYSFPFPPLSEQQEITDYLDKKCSEIDSLIALKQAKIEELKDYKKSIIYEYVTGKKEVQINYI